MNGQILKIHSDFYYVNFENEVYECKIREVLKKQKIKVLVGDFVECAEVNKNKKTAVIEKIFPRKNFLTRPSVANVEQVVIVSSIKEPDLNFEQLNRYISLAKHHKIKTKLCFNKNDLSEDDSVIEKVFQIYEPLGFEIIFTSALENIGLEDFIQMMKGKTTVFCGNSGVGKSSLINAIAPGLNIRTKQVSEKTSRGVHTTRHCEIIEIANKKRKLENSVVASDCEAIQKAPSSELRPPSPARGEGTAHSTAQPFNRSTIRIIDTPGFSNLKFDFLLPTQIDELFDEIKKYKSECKFKDCLHIEEEGCNVLAHIDEIDISRYQSYLSFVNEAQEYKERIKTESLKKETSLKEGLNRQVAKISVRKRQAGRSTLKQNIYKDLDAIENEE